MTYTPTANPKLLKPYVYFRDMRGKIRTPEKPFDCKALGLEAEAFKGCYRTTYAFFQRWFHWKQDLYTSA